MNKDILINLRTTTELKESFQEIVEREGFTMSEVLEAAMKDIVRRGLVPNSLVSKVERKRGPLLTIPFIKRCLEEALSEMDNPHIRKVSLFGSYAKGTATPGSDVDLYLEADSEFGLLDLAGLEIALRQRLGKKVEVATKSDDPYFINVIKKERIPLYERER